MDKIVSCSSWIAAAGGAAILGSTVLYVGVTSSGPGYDIAWCHGAAYYFPCVLQGFGGGAFGFITSICYPS